MKHYTRTLTLFLFISVLFGQPTFTEYVISNSADYAYSVHAADVDGDGDMDVLSASAKDDTVAWYENKSSSRTGDGVVKYQVPANESAEQRTGTITVAGKTHTVVQAGAEVLAKPVIG